MFFENIKKVPVQFTAAFYVHEEDSKASIVVYDPKGNVIYRMKKKNRSFIKFDINYPGVYEFSFESYKVSSISKFQYLHTYNLIIIDYY